jgi:hypothetical protein
LMEAMLSDSWDTFLAEDVYPGVFTCGMPLR